MSVYSKAYARSCSVHSCKAKIDSLKNAFNFQFGRDEVSGLCESSEGYPFPFLPKVCPSFPQRPQWDDTH
ncbi:hypothetical protein TNCV_4684121 [Trichonephila clavipes]|nr:hypothetical protein TNCV_4684121 [Trichonephila clavipes]